MALRHALWVGWLVACSATRDADRADCAAPDVALEHNGVNPDVGVPAFSDCSVLAVGLWNAQRAVDVERAYTGVGQLALARIANYHDGTLTVRETGYDEEDRAVWDRVDVGEDGVDESHGLWFYDHEDFPCLPTRHEADRYDADGNAAADGVYETVWTMSYEDGRLSSLLAEGPNASASELEYDEDGHMVSRTVVRGGLTSRSEYTYDAQGRLTGVDIDSPDDEQPGDAYGYVWTSQGEVGAYTVDIASDGWIDSAAYTTWVGGRQATEQLTNGSTVTSYTFDWTCEMPAD